MDFTNSWGRSFTSVPLHPSSTDQKQMNETVIVQRRIAKRTSYGALLGAIAGMVLQPPFKGITTTSADVQGLTYVSWFMASLGGMIVGFFAGLIGRSKSRETTGKES